jgi:hypothetical protein
VAHFAAIEDVVEIYPDYLLVENRGAAARMAETTDPRGAESSDPSA